VPFYVLKGHLLHVKRASFTLQKGVFYNAKEHQLKSTLTFIVHYQSFPSFSFSPLLSLTTPCFILCSPPACWWDYGKI